MRIFVWVVVSFIAVVQAASAQNITLTSDIGKIDNRNDSITFIVENYPGQGPLRLQFRRVEQGESVLVRGISCNRVDSGKWTGVWYGKDDLGRDVANGKYEVFLAGTGIPADFPSMTVEVERYQILSNLTVSPIPYWPMPFKGPGGEVAERKANISFVLTQKRTVAVGIFPPDVSDDVDTWEGAVTVIRISELDPGKRVFPWDGKWSDGRRVEEEGEYTVVVSAVDPKDPSNRFVRRCPFILKQIPVIDPPLCNPVAFSPDGDRINDSTAITFRVITPVKDLESATVVVAVSIHNESGMMVNSLVGKTLPAGRTLVLHWNGTAAPSELFLLTAEEEKPVFEEVSPPLPNGIYSVQIKAVDVRTNTEADAVTAKVEIKNPVNLEITSYMARAADIAEVIKGRQVRAGGIDEEFWAAPDEEWAVKLIAGDEAGRARTGTLVGLPKLPLPLLLPIQSYMPWIRYEVTKKAEVTLQIYSEAGGSVETLELGTSNPDEMKKIELKTSLESLSDGAFYRAVLWATDTDIESPITVKSEFRFQVFRAEYPQIQAKDDWLTMRTTPGMATLEGKPVSDNVTFDVIVPENSVVSVRIFESLEDLKQGREPVTEWKCRKDEQQGTRRTITWDGMREYRGSRVHVKEGIYCYQVVTERLDQTMLELRQMMPGVNLKTTDHAEKLWVVALPTPRFEVFPGGRLISPDGISEYQYLFIDLSCDLGNLSVQGSIFEKPKRTRITSLPQVTVLPFRSSRCEWNGENDAGVPVADGEYEILWTTTCDKIRTDPVTKAEETLTYLLDVDPLTIKVDRKPVISDLRVEPERISPDNDGVDDEVVIHFKTGDVAEVTARIHGVFESRNLCRLKYLKDGDNSLPWDGRNNDGHYFKRGMAVLSFHLLDPQGNVYDSEAQIEIISYFPDMADALDKITEALWRISDNAHETRRQKYPGRFSE